MTFEQDDPRRRLSVRAQESLHEAIDRYADENGISKSEAVRNAIESHVPEVGDTGPNDPQHRKAYEWLKSRADERGRVPADLAQSKLAQELQIDKRFIKRLYLKPLRKKGWIDAKNGILHLTQAEE